MRCGRLLTGTKLFDLVEVVADLFDDVARLTPANKKLVVEREIVPRHRSKIPVSKV